jgi:hypothetical protein
MKYIKKLLSEQTRTTERGEKTKGMPRPAQQPNSTRTKPDIKKKVEMAREVGPKKGQLPGSKPEREDSHTVYKQMGMLMAEALGLVSEEVKQMPPVGKWKKPGDLSKEAEEARAAGKKPAKSVRRNPNSIDYPKGGRP